MRLTQKCQVTIPKSVRDKLGIGPGSEVGFEPNEKGEFSLVKLESHRDGENAGQRLVRELVEFGDRMRAEGKSLDLTTDEIMEMTRGPFDDLDAR